MASPETGYYGIPLLKQPSWTWEIPLYFFVGGAAGAAAVVGAIADYTGADRKLVRDARWIAAAGAVISPALLISDLGRPERFLNMMRVFNAREGLTRAEDKLPKKFFKALAGTGPTADVALGQEELAQAQDMYYELSGWDAASGNPTAETLRRLDLDWVL